MVEKIPSLVVGGVDLVRGLLLWWWELDLRWIGDREIVEDWVGLERVEVCLVEW